jgi:hypothetical protein
MAHPLTAYDGTRDLNTTLLTDNAAEADAPVFAAVTFIIFFRSEYALVKKAVLLGSLCAVVVSGFVISPKLHSSMRSGEARRIATASKSCGIMSFFLIAIQEFD